MEFLISVLANLTSDVLFILCTIVVGWVVLISFKRKRLLDFFGINADRRFVIYLSNLKLQPGQTFGIDNKRRMYTGSAVAFGEMQSADKVRSLFNYFLPSLSETPNLLSKLLISDVQTQIQPSPTIQGQLEQSASFMTLGTAAYNLASSFAVENLHSMAKFTIGKNAAPASVNSDKPFKPMGLVDTDNKPSPMPSGTIVPEYIQFTTSGSPGEALSFLSSGDKSSENFLKSLIPDSPTSIVVEGIPPLTESIYGFVERIVDHKQKRFIFYVAGISELSTVGAANYLITEWERLYRKFGNDKDFLIMLKIEPTDHRRWNIIFEK